MDGETLDSELLNELAHNPEMQKTWESYHLIRDSMRGDTPEVLHFDISSRVMAAIEEEPVRQPATLIPEAQPAPHQWQKMPFWQKVRPWAAQLTQMGVAACVSLAVIVGVQHYNGQSETSQQPESAACTSLTLSAPTVTFEDAGRFFNITFTRKPAECTEPVTFTSSDENVATVSEQGKIVAVNAGSAVITAACGEQTAQCLVTCDFAYVGAETTEEGSVPLALSKDDLTFFNAGEQYTLSVTGAPEGAKITYVSSDESIATVSSSGVLTAKGSGTTTISVTVDDNPAMTCIVRCNFEDGAAESGDCTISNSDVTMGVKGETFQISLRDANGNKITGLLWVSSDLSICSVDGTGVVKAEGSGTAYVSTTYNGISYQCIVRCNLH